MVSACHQANVFMYFQPLDECLGYILIKQFCKIDLYTGERKDHQKLSLIEKGNGPHSVLRLQDLTCTTLFEVPDMSQSL